MKNLQGRSAAHLRLVASAAAFVALCVALTASAQQSAGAKAVVRHGFNLDGRIEGSVQQLAGENTTLNAGAGSVYVPAGRYRSLTANGGSTLVLGVPGADSGKYIEPKDGPFTVRLSAATQPDKSDLVRSSDKTLKVEIDSMEYTPDGDYKSFKPNLGAA